MNTATDLDQRLQRLRGRGEAPVDLWPQIAAALQTPNTRASTTPTLTPVTRFGTHHKWPWASAALLVLALGLSLLVRIPYPAGSANRGNDAALSTWEQASLRHSGQALDQQLVGFYQQWPTVMKYGHGLEAALINPELQAMGKSRAELREALRQNPDSPQLLHQLARLDQWQFRLLRQLAKQSEQDLLDTPMEV